jgi:hypothetical protein
MPTLNARNISQDLLDTINHNCNVRLISQGELLRRLVALHQACKSSPAASAQSLLKECELQQITVTG